MHSHQQHGMAKSTLQFKTCYSIKFYDENTGIVDLSAPNHTIIYEMSLSNYINYMRSERPLRKFVKPSTVTSFEHIYIVLE